MKIIQKNNLKYKNVFAQKNLFNKHIKEKLMNQAKWKKKEIEKSILSKKYA